MIRIKNKMLMVIVCSLLSMHSVWAQKLISFEFIDQKITDIVFAFSSFSERSIIADETVQGNASFLYAGFSFDEAFDVFLKTNRLYKIQEADTCRVSKIKVVQEENDEGSVYFLDAYDSTISSILEKISIEIGQTIIFSNLPSTKISVHIKSNDFLEFLELSIKSFFGYKVEVYKNAYLVSQIQGNLVHGIQGNQNVQGQTHTFTLEEKNGMFSCSIWQAKTSEVFLSLCGLEGSSYVNLLKNDPLVSGLHVNEVDFETLLETVLIHAGVDSFIDKSIRYFIPSKTQDTSRRARDTKEKWEALSVRFIEPSKVYTLCTSRFPEAEIISQDQSRVLLFKSSEERIQEAKEFLALIDTSVDVEAITLQYISASELIRNIPPGFDKNNIIETGLENLIYFNGSSEAKKIFLNQLEKLDKPKDRIRYDLLIIQYDTSKNNTWKSSIDFEKTEYGDATAILGNFSNLLSLNFDVITLFGYAFSSKLEASLAENNAKIFTDTTLHALSGETVQFKNTNTYRYKDTAIDPDTGKPMYTGVTREIISGIILDITGNVSGSQLITMKIDAAISKRGTDVSFADNPPPTSEKSISTKLSTKNGEPVIVSGLVQEDTSVSENRIPIISKIPIIGRLFSNTYTTKTNSEMIIYIVPHISNQKNENTDAEVLAKTACARLIENVQGGM